MLRFVTKAVQNRGLNAVLKTRSFSLTARARLPLVLDELNPAVVNAEYAVRGRLALRAEELNDTLQNSPGTLPFSEVVNANIGNPQQLDQKPITFMRQVLSLLQYPQLMENPEAAKAFKPDAIARAQTLLKAIGSVGAYSHSKGVPYIRESVAKFIEQRDGFPADPNSIYLTTGASTAVSYLLSTFAQDKSSGFLIPIPQYPLYSATLTLVNSTAVPYFLDESAAWSTKVQELETTIQDALEAGITLKSIVVINPGNPTGACLSESEIEEILKLAARSNIVVIADEVYQANVFKGKFFSFKGVLRKLQAKYPSGEYDHVELASLHSTSKGMSGECGQRGGYMELVGFSPEVEDTIYKLASISLCPVVTGQALMECMVNPPKKGDASYEQYTAEYNGIYETLKSRAYNLYEAFQEMEGVECQEPQGAMYLFPKIHLPQRAIDEATKHGEKPDELYCMELLENTGICVIPGSGFGQEHGTFHFRTTFLAPGEDYAKRLVKFHKEFMQKYK
ncbi:putative alanine aminotransferase [Nadsonia fulvescens var. elongata DSM 6958]|uniref:Glutamate pyruvate transaminase n=1 Tax=Nadsonia fulvescens var. elongata DSM 6958 TaxID=857566 RepID=A0A1E3PEB3_9ASCO|nr:putative alanine aminotransferase [Nadsonia fulvescens var. elongata DSM 6958]